MPGQPKPRPGWSVGGLHLSLVLLLSLTGLGVVMPFTTKQATNNLPARHNVEENFFSSSRRVSMRVSILDVGLLPFAFAPWRALQLRVL